MQADPPTETPDAGKRRLVSSAACLGAATLAALLYAPYGFNGLDDGFVQALAWRVLEGQRPYVDFVYVRPPGSVLLHAVPLALLPVELSVIAERVGLFATIAVYSFLTAGLLTRAGRGAGVLRVSPWLLGLTAFVVATQDFPPMPWHTVDGVLFSVLATGCVVRARGGVGLTAGALASLVAASCKQPFFLVPIVLCGFVWRERGRRDGWIFGLALAVGLAAATVALALAGPLAEVLGQWTAGGRPASLFHAGVVSYVRAVPYFLIPLGGAWAADRIRRALGGRPLPPSLPAYAVVVWMFGSDIVRTLAAGRFQTPAFNYPGALWLVALAVVVFGWTGTGGPESHRDGSAARGLRSSLAVLLAIAWAASISWGYPTPVLLAAPVVAGGLLAAETWCKVPPQRLLAMALPLALAAQFVGYRYPYREAPRARLTADLGKTFERLTFIRGSDEQRDKLEELKALHERHPTFTVLPGLPAAHLLTGATPPVGVDWARNAETAGRDARLIAELEASGAVVFMERTAEPPCADGPGCSALAAHVAERWIPIETGRAFRVYRRPGAGAGALDRPGGVQYVGPAGGNRE